MLVTGDSLHLGVEVAAGLWLRATEQCDAEVMFLAARTTALTQFLSVLRRQEMVTHSA